MFHVEPIFLHVSRVLKAVLAVGVIGELNDGTEKKLCLRERRLYDTNAIETRISKETMKLFVFIKILLDLNDKLWKYCNQKIK